MRTLFLPFLASLVVLFALFVLISEDHTAPSGSGLRIDGERSSDLGGGLMEVLLLRLPGGPDLPRMPAIG
jgi:hypothetical protein